MTYSPFSSMTLRNLELPVHLGWTDAERVKKQLVSIDVFIRFIQPPKACASDHLDDTYCYDNMVSHIKELVSAKPFCLIEHLAYIIYDGVKKFTRNAHDEKVVSVRVIKKPAVPHLNDGVAFCVGDEEIR